MENVDFADVKVGVHLVFKKVFPCEVLEVKISRPDYHGYIKKMCRGVDVITDKKYDEVFIQHRFIPCSHRTLRRRHTRPIKVPLIDRTIYQLIYMNYEGYVSLMDDSGDIREDLQILGDMYETAQSFLEDDKNINVLVLSATIDDCTQERVLSVTKLKD